MSSPYELSDDLPVYVISVAAQLSGMHPQTLRAYDRLGLVSPGRSQGRGRRYSMRDILALREIQRLSQDEGVNLSGIKLILDQHRELEQARRLIAELHASSLSCGWSSNPPALWRPGWPSCAARAVTTGPGWCLCAAPGWRYGNQ